MQNENEIVNKYWKKTKKVYESYLKENKTHEKKRKEYIKIFVAIYHNEGINQNKLYRLLEYKPSKPTLIKFLNDYKYEGKIIIKGVKNSKGFENKISLSDKQRENVKQYLKLTNEIKKGNKDKYIYKGQ